MHLAISVFRVKRGELVVVVGETGSGKSSLIAALMGEMRRKEGFVKLDGTVSVCLQVPWIQNANSQNQ
jgi:ATP-binding cassette, subfamily C (CFTR/MRP), member 1